MTCGSWVPAQGIAKVTVIVEIEGHPTVTATFPRVKTGPKWLDSQPVYREREVDAITPATLVPALRGIDIGLRVTALPGIDGKIYTMVVDR